MGRTEEGKREEWKERTEKTEEGTAEKGRGSDGGVRKPSRDGELTVKGEGREGCTGVSREGSHIIGKKEGTQKRGMGRLKEGTMEGRNKSSMMESKTHLQMWVTAD